ncbi:MAG: HigA family addiction module antitoxin [Chloroflexota bacterium]|nr:HigA family addiction module antitoxin [Chloroflexota bacterium]
MARPPIHPGEILTEELAFLDFSAPALARDLDVPIDQIAAILRGEQGITADMALRLSRWLGTSPELWLTLQSRYELRKAQAEVGEEIQARVRPRQAAV